MSTLQARNAQTGFTLIELMIVVAIIAILAAIAIPAYQNYLIRSQVSEGLTVTGGLETGVEEFYSNSGRMPATNGSAGVAAPASIVGKYVMHAGMLPGGNGLVAVVFGNKANKVLYNHSLLLSPVTKGGSMSWVCSPKAMSAFASGLGWPVVSNKYLPSSCRH